MSELTINAREALNRWYMGETDDPSEVIMYAENLIQRVQDLQTAVDDALITFVDTAWQKAYRHLVSSPPLPPKPRINLPPGTHKNI